MIFYESIKIHRHNQKEYMKTTTMTERMTNEIWVFGDLRSRALLDDSFAVLAKARVLAQKTGDRVAMFTLTPKRAAWLTASENDSCTIEKEVEQEAFAWGADVVYRLENERFASPTAHDFSTALAEIVQERSPRLVLFPLTDFGRDISSRAAAVVRAGLMADCVEFKVGNDGDVVGRCPAWGGEIMAEIGYVPGHGIGFATVHPSGAADEKVEGRKGHIERIQMAGLPTKNSIRLVSSKPVSKKDGGLENAGTVVVGGAGLGTMENFGQIRQLAAVLAGEVAATRPPVLNHWVAEDRMIGQTGKTIHPDLLISVGTSGAIQYTAGIMESSTIVAINRDPAAPIFRLADVGVVADASSFIPLLISRIRQVVMRKLADDVCADTPVAAEESRFGDKIKTLRRAQGWSVEHLAETTGQTPEFIADVEAGKISPPVAFLLRLSTAYGVDPGTFLKDEEKEQIRDQRAQAYVNRTRNYSYQTLTSGAEHDHLRAFMITIEPHHDHKPVAYKHEGEEFIFVMEGELELTLGNKVNHLKRGESIHFHSNIPHKLKSLTSQITRCLVILYTI